MQALSAPLSRLIESESGNLLARITAVQLSGRLGMQEEVPTLLRIAHDESQAKTLRIAAVGAVGHLGNTTRDGCLPELASGKDERLRAAAVSALSLIKEHGKEQH
jgi:HEAT repeat protein